MVRRRSNIDWYNVFLDAFSHDGAVDGSSDSPTPAPPQAAAMEPRNEYERRFGPGAPQVDGDDGPHFRLNRALPAKAAVDLGPDVHVPSASKGVDDFSPMDEDEQGGHVSPKHCSNSYPKSTEHKKNDGQGDVGLGLDLSSASKGVNDFSPMDEDEQEKHVSLQQCSKSSPKKKNRGQLHLNKRNSQGHGGKRKPSVNKMRARTTDSEESDYESSLPSGFSERTKNQQLQNSSSVHSRKVQDLTLLDDEDMEPKEEVNHDMFDRLFEKGKPIASAWLQRLKGPEEVMSNNPFQDALSHSRMKRTEGDEDDTGSSKRILDAVFETPGTKLWVTRVYRPTSGTALAPGNRCWSSGGSRKDDRVAFIEQFRRKDSSPATDVATAAAAAKEEEEEEEEVEEARDAVDQALDSRRDGRPIRKPKPNPKCFGPQWAQYSRKRRGEERRKK